MVLVSMLRQTAAKRIPMIKFRRQREDEAAAARIGSVNSSAPQGKSSSSPSAAISLPTIEDWQLPNRYRRKQMDDFEMEYINRGGPA